ncbi:hypothetical protein AVHY2522_10935 [Acidovorax sp. SUPP2522]|uniref:hypothetical protein n=1 Tax=unclassified Acidovorax TaxID=2684926 RepID=UPI002349FEDD|nr:MULTISPECIES: hypothetical protein [unclassified Acidovorax]WCM99392.1 hypothetical protein M5C96_08250 [Acidovorax sp. GBBC 1281]GKT16234.1 hypothetical protein AVHY2522_10935 [Acidovorax sp. SUPP2522]
MADTVCTRTSAQTTTSHSVVQGLSLTNPRCAEVLNALPGMQQAPVTERVSTSLIVLTLRPDGAKFNGNRITRAQEAGFDWLKDDATFIGYASPDTGREIARFVTNKSDEAFGALREIQLRIDPAVCEWQWNAGQILMGKLQRYAVLVGGHICDGLGQRIADTELSSIAAHIDAVMKKRRDADQRARTVTLPSGEQRELSELSFSYGVVREAGSKKKTWRSVLFDVPALPYYEGRALGMQMAGEVVQFYRKHRTEKLRLDVMLHEALQRCNGGFGNYDKATQSNVAAGFIDALTTMIELGARQMNPKWLEAQIVQNQQRHETWCQERDERKAEFAERMRQARAAKRAAREVNHGV